MRIAVHAVGRMKSGPEKDLADRFFDRFAKAGPAIGLEFSGVSETAENRARGSAERKHEEARKVGTLAAPGTLVILLDERGSNLSSEEFAGKLASWRDSGQKSLAIVIGGPDGHDASLRHRAELVMSFGAATWPHQIVRVMLAEQLYRAATILSGHPYHRS